MKADTLLDSVVFQLTPTRTRYDLVIIANGKSEKIASGLLDPFLAHLKTAKDQIAKGGYSIRLELHLGTDASWFTKDTVERFVRYVSTPEVLERVSTLESEILQINEAIAIQGNGRISLGNVEDSRGRGAGSMEGTRSLHNGTDTEKVIVLSKHGKHRRLSTGSTTHEANSRRQLLKVLEARKTVLHKEQGMAFARAVAAGFGMDRMENLILFAKSFGASRLLEACFRFVNLWKATHKNEQLLEVGYTETPQFQSEFTSMTASGSGDDWKKKEFTEPWIDNLDTENNETDNHATNSNAQDQRLCSDHRVLLAPQSCHGQIQNPMLPHWASLGPPVSQSYPVQNISYYQNYPVSFSAFQSPYPPTDDPLFNSQTGFERHFVDPVSEVGEDRYDEEFEKRIGLGRKSQEKAGHSGKRRSTVGSGESKRETQSSSDVDYEEVQTLQSNSQSRKHRNSSRSVENNATRITEKDHVVDGKGGDTGHWQAFQKLLLKVQKESESTVDRDMFSPDEPQGRRRANKSQADPSIPPARNNKSALEMRMVRCDIDGGGNGYCRPKNDDFMISRSVKKVNNDRTSNPLSENEFEDASNFQEGSLYNASDESFIVPLRSDELKRDKKTVMDMTSDFHAAQKNNDYSQNKNQHSYEPHDLRMVPERGFEKGSSGYDPAKDFDMQISIQNGCKKETRGQDVLKRASEGLKISGKGRKSNSAPYTLGTRKVDAMTVKGKSSKMNPLADAKARADRLRAYKADLQKAKKEKEEEERKRLEVLKQERQKRIVARSSLNVAQSSLHALQTKSRNPTTHFPKSRNPTRHSPSSCNGSKFHDKTPSTSQSNMPRSSKSPLKPQKIQTVLTPKPSPDSYKGSKFSDAEPSSSSPLLKLIRSSKTLPQSSCKLQEKKVTGLFSRSTPISSKNGIQSTGTPQENAAQKSASVHPSFHKGSKFSDMAVSSSLPLQKFPTRTTSASSPESNKITKLTRLNGSSHLVRNGSRQSAIPESRPKKVINHARRASDPEVSKLHPSCSVRPLDSNQVPKKTIFKEPPVKSMAATQPKKTIFKEPPVKSMAATQPSRTRKLMETGGEHKNNLGVKATMEKTGSRLLSTSESIPAKESDEVAVAVSNNEDEPIIEKAVLILENKTIPSPVVRASKVMANGGVRPPEGSKEENSELAWEIPVVPVPSAQFSAAKVDSTTKYEPEAQPSSFEVVSQNFRNSLNCENPNQSYLTHVLYAEESTVGNREHTDEHVDHKGAVIGSDGIHATSKLVDSLSVEQGHEMDEKPHGRGSTKGIRNLLKFRRKGQSSTSSELNEVASAVDGSTITVPANNAPKLKNLLSTDSHTAVTPPKASRPFSLLLPFKIKSNDKNIRS